MSFVLQEDTDDWLFYRHMPESIIAPLNLSIGIMKADARMVDGPIYSRETSKVFVIESDAGREVELVLLNGGDIYKVNIVKDGKGFSHEFDQNGKLVASSGYEQAYKTTEMKN